MTGRIVVLLLLAHAFHAAPAGADERVAAGALHATAATDAWRLTFTDSRGREVLREAEALGYRTATGPATATRIRSARRDGAAAVLEVQTTGAHDLQVRIEPDRDGVIRVRATVPGAAPGEVTAMGIGFAARDGERYLGFGERSNAVDQRGRVVESQVSDGPYQPEERPFIAAIVPSPGFRPRDDATYFPMPWLLSTAGYGVLVDNDETTTHHLDRPGSWRLETAAGSLSFRVFAGPRPADVLRRLTSAIGRQPPPAAAWFFGPWFQPRGNVDAQIAEARKLRAAGAPTSVAQTYAHYLPCGAQQNTEDDQRRRTRELHALGFAVTTYFNPMVCTRYQPVFGEAERRGLLTKDATGRPYLYRYGASADADDQFLVGQFDFSNPEAGAYFGELLGEAIGHGYDGWMEDFGEYTPFDARSHDGTSGAAMHNRYPVLYHAASERYARPRGTAGFIRSGWTGVHPHAQLVWGGDPTTDWGFDGLRSAVTQGLTMGLSGISRWGSDIGGFFALGRRRLTPELLIRWIQVGAVSGVMRTQANGVGVPPQPDRPQILDEDVLPVWKRYATFRTRLYPYWRAADATYRRTGLPLMRHLALVDASLADVDDAFLVGRDLLAAPVLDPGAEDREVRLPRRHGWLPLSPDLTLDSRMRRSVSGRVGAPLDHLPLFVRVGAVLPLLPRDVATLADHGAGGAVRLADRRGRLELLAFPRGRTTSRYDERGRIRSIEGHKRWILRLSRRKRVLVRASFSQLRRPFRPCRANVRSWRYDAAKQVLTARFSGRRLVVSGDGCGSARRAGRPH